MELLRKQDEESATVVIECFPAMIAIPTKQVSLFVKRIINVMCGNCEEYVDPNTHLCYMKPIVNEDEEWQGECKKKQKPRQKTQAPLRRDDRQ